MKEVKENLQGNEKMLQSQTKPEIDQPILTKGKQIFHLNSDGVLYPPN